MLTTHAERTEFLRYVYDGGGASEAARQAYVSTWRVAALDAIRDGGNVTNSSSNAVSVGLSVPTGWTPAHVTELAAWSRGYLSETTITLALADVPVAVRRFSTDFSGVRV